MKKSKFSIFALHQRLSRPATTVVFTIFVLGYLLYLCTLLTINAQKDWYTEQAPVEWDGISFYEIYTFEYYFKGIDYTIVSVNDTKTYVTNSTTPYLIHSEPVFLVSLLGIVLALSLAHIKTEKNETMKRLPVLDRTAKVMQWSSDFIYTLCIWLSHLIVIFLFYMIYNHFAPVELTYPQNLYLFFATVRYLYMLFPVLNPISLVRMFSLVFAVSFLPSFISLAFGNILDRKSKVRTLLSVGIKIGLICWGYFASTHVMSIIACLIALAAGVFNFVNYISMLPEGET
jgi:hypothetical protein